MVFECFNIGFKDFNFGKKHKFWIMKYKRGSTVEVFCAQSWRCARIVYGKGHNYTVSYDVYPGFTDKDDVERVSVESIRPCPPLLEISESWIPGDVAEVFHNLSWKMAIVLKDFGLDQFLVRIVESSQEFEVMKSELRVRQSYRKGEWIVISKVPSDYKDANSTKLLKYDQDSGSQAKQKETIEDSRAKDLCFDAQNNHLMESHVTPSKTLKRASTCRYSQDETDTKRARKLRMSEKEAMQARVLGTSHKVVVDVANRKTCIDTACGYESSSGSCSMYSYKPYEIYHGQGYVEDIEDHESDAESICRFEDHEEKSQETDESAANETAADEIHRLELHAYRNTMAALHASGPLSWENETMVTNLRLSLHISNDEHMTMLKHLLYAPCN
ncbi:hypothetical protein QVD17_03312 [Tagetes erecta]|uniref:ENT domain-containing protein n=1 Tax=Tagetes erecta TaxID=13708 RepID=A0AAD8P392_TARER|nr:hypothetical protein QVD17_03312 [Tagetes erecta]